MTSRKRRLLFYGFFILFLIIGFGVVAFSFGWRIDFENFGIKKTGGISVRTQPRGVIIKINDKVYPDKSGLIQSETVITNLLPKSYHLKIEKLGYHSYEKDLNVEPSLVARVLNILLIPQKISAQKIFGVRGQILSAISADENKFIVKNNASGTFYLYDKNNPETALNLTVLLNNIKSGSQIKRVAFVPFQSEQIAIEDVSGLKLLDVKKRTLETIYKGVVLDWQIQNSTLYFIKSELQKTENLVAVNSYNLIFKTTEPIFQILKNQIPSSIIKLKAASGNGRIAILDKDKNLFLYSEIDKNLSRLENGVLDFDFAPDNKKIAVLKDGKLIIQFLEDFNSDIQKKTGERITLNLNAWGIPDKINWHKDSYHVLVNFGNDLKIVEIDDRAPLNVFDVLSGFISWQYNDKSNILYLIKAAELEMLSFGNL